jgi:division protein CdvB (Snf7/Vps24/ESCRT-III family)
METEKFAKQMIYFQKATFDNTFTAVTMLQDQAERMFNTVIEQTTWLPEESRRFIDEWVGTYKKGRADFKGAMDENFVKLADLIEAVPTPKKPQAPTLEAVPTLKEPQTSPMPKTK